MTDLVFDGSALLARAWFATSKDFIDPDAVLRSALQTTFSLVNRDVDRIGQTINRTIFCWDGKHGHDKGPRPAKPSHYEETKELFKELLTYLIGTVHATPPRHEADDAVATVVENSPAEDIYVVSADKDLFQLHADQVHCYCLHAKMLVSKEYVTSKFSVKHPRQIAIALAIIGDRVDNIPGIRGWGPAKVKTMFEAVNEEMGFQEALDVIVNQIPDKHLESFYASLERTLLDPTLKGLPAPAEVVFASVADAVDCGVENIGPAFSRMRESYAERMAMSRVPLGDMNECG